MLTKKGQRDYTVIAIEVAELLLLMETSDTSVSCRDLSSSAINSITACLERIAGAVQNIDNGWLNENVGYTSQGLEAESASYLNTVTAELRVISNTAHSSLNVPRMLLDIREKMETFKGHIMQVIATAENTTLSRFDSSLEQLKDQLGAVMMANSIAELVPAFRLYAEALLLSLHLMEQLRCQLLDHQLIVCLGTCAMSLRSLSPDLVTKLQVKLEQPDGESAKADCEDIHCQILRVIDDVKSAITLVSSSENQNDMEENGAGKFVEDIDEALDCVLAMSAVPATVYLDASGLGLARLDVLTDSIVRHSICVAAATGSQEHRNLVSTACLHLLSARRQLLSASTYAHTWDADGTGGPPCQPLNVAQAEMEAALHDVERHVNSTLLYDIVDVFKESCEPLEYLLSSAVSQQQESPSGSMVWMDQIVLKDHHSLKHHAKGFEDHANRMCCIGNHFASSCAEHDVRKRLEATTSSLRMLQGSLLACIASSSATLEMEQLHHLARQWQRELRHMVSIIDNSTDVSLFLRTTEHQLRAEVAVHAQCWNDSHIDSQRQLQLRNFARAVVGRAERAAAVARVAIARAATRGGPSYVIRARECTDDLLRAAASFHAEAWRLAETADIQDDSDNAVARKSADEKLMLLLDALASLRCHIILADSPERAGRHCSSAEHLGQDSDIISHLGSPDAIPSKLTLGTSYITDHSFGTSDHPISSGSSTSDCTLPYMTSATPDDHTFLPLSLKQEGSNQKKHIFTKPLAEQWATGVDEAHLRTAENFLSLPVWSPGQPKQSTYDYESSLPTIAAVECLGKAFHPPKRTQAFLTNKMTWEKSPSVFLDCPLAENLPDAAVDVDLSLQVKRAKDGISSGELLKRVNTCLDIASAIVPQDANKERKRVIKKLKADVAVLTPYALEVLQDKCTLDIDESLTVVRAWCRAVNNLEALCNDYLVPYQTLSNNVVKAALQHNVEFLRVEVNAMEQAQIAARRMVNFVDQFCSSSLPFSAGGVECIKRQMQLIDRLNVDLEACALRYAADNDIDELGRLEENQASSDVRRVRRQALTSLSRSWALAVFDLNVRIQELCDDYVTSADSTLGSLCYSNCVKETEEARVMLHTALAQPGMDSHLAERGIKMMAVCDDALSVLCSDDNGTAAEHGVDSIKIFAGSLWSSKLCAWHIKLKDVHALIDVATGNACKYLDDLFDLSANSSTEVTEGGRLQVYREQLEHLLQLLTGRLSAAMSAAEHAANECNDHSLKMEVLSAITALRPADALAATLHSCMKPAADGSYNRMLSEKCQRQYKSKIVRLCTAIRQLIPMSIHSAVLQDALMHLNGHQGTDGCTLRKEKLQVISANVMAVASKLLGGNSLSSNFHEFLGTTYPVPPLTGSRKPVAGSGACTPKPSLGGQPAVEGVTPPAVNQSLAYQANMVKSLLAKSKKAHRDTQRGQFSLGAHKKWVDDSLPIANAAKQMTEQISEIYRLGRLRHPGSADKEHLLALVQGMITNSAVVMELTKALIQGTPDLRLDTKTDLLFDYRRVETVAMQLKIVTTAGSSTVDDVETRKLVVHNAKELMASVLEAVKHVEATFIEVRNKFAGETTDRAQALMPAVMWMQQLKEYRHIERKHGQYGSKALLNELGLRVVARNTTGPELREIFNRF